MPKQTASKLYLVPFKPTRGVFHKQRARGAGVAIALAELLSRNGFPISIMNFSPEDADDPAALLLGGELGEREWAAVGGYYKLKGLSPLKLVVVPPSSEEPAGEREFDLGDDEGLDGFVAGLREWLGGFGAGERDAPLDDLTPQTPDQLDADTWFYGLEWLVDEVETVLSEEFQRQLGETLKFFRGLLGDPYADRRLRELALTLIGPMQAKRFPALEDEERVMEGVGMLSSRMNAAGIEEILPALDEGVERGADRVAFRACRAYVLLTLDRAEEAVEDFKAVKEAGAERPALFGLGRAYTYLNRTSEARRVLERALKKTKPGEPFADIVHGVDAPPAGDGRTWLGMLLAARGQAELDAGDFAAAEKSLLGALEEGTDEPGTLDLLASTYGQWAEQQTPKKRREAVRLFKEQLAALERLYRIDPRYELIGEALTAATEIRNPAIEKVWLRRKEELEEQLRA